MADYAQPRRSTHIVGPNPSMDRTQFVEGLALGEVNRAVRAEPMAGGKGIIVARAMRRLGTPAAMYGFVGGATGQYIRDECRLLGVTDRHTEVAGDTRVNAIIVDARTGDATVVNEPGPAVTPVEVERLFEELLPQIAQGDIVALSGSLPRGLDASFAMRLVRDARERGARVIIDTSGEPLEAAVTAAPWAVKCNLDEFRVLRPDAPAVVGDEGDRQRLIAQMNDLRGRGIEIVAVTLGADGAVVVSDTGAVSAHPPRIEVRNATGSGDTFLAGLLHALALGRQMPDAIRLAVAASARNAMLPLPDIGADPDLTALLAGTVIEVVDEGTAR